MGVTPTIDSQPEKTMLRVYSGDSKGATSFFRNRPLLRALMMICGGYPSRQIKVLFHAGSIGAEAYSFAAYCRMFGLHRTHEIQLFATDIDANFLEFARQARYPESILVPMTPQERVHFRRFADGYVSPSEDVRSMVSFLPPLSFVEAVSDEKFDFIFVMNAITYVSEREQAITLRNIASYNSGYLIATAFHPDTIESDLRGNGYVPVSNDIEQIHEAWGERIRTGELASPGTPEYSWVLPRFSRIPGFEYKYCAIFRKAVQALLEVETAGASGQASCPDRLSAEGPQLGSAAIA